MALASVIIYTNILNTETTAADLMVNLLLGEPDVYRLKGQKHEVSKKRVELSTTGLRQIQKLDSSPHKVMRLLVTLGYFHAWVNP